MEVTSFIRIPPHRYPKNILKIKYFEYYVFSYETFTTIFNSRLIIMCLYPATYIFPIEYLIELNVLIFFFFDDFSQKKLGNAVYFNLNWKFKYYLYNKVENLEDLLKEKDNQVDMARARLSAMQAHHCSSEGALSSLEEAIGDKEKQMSQLREQRDRAEQEKQEERELHEREIAEYKMKIHALNSEVEKLNARVERAQNDRDRLEAKLESSQSELGKSKAELDKAAVEVGRSGADWEAARQRLARLELENERLKNEMERSNPTTTTFGRNIYSSSHELDRAQERVDKTSSDLRR